MTVEEILKRMDSGMPKLWLIHKTMRLRRDKPDWFDNNSSYSSLPVEGPRKEHLVAYLRGESVAVIAPRWNARLNGNLASTIVRLPDGQWNHLLTGENFDGGTLRAQQLFRRFPVALLVRNEE
jgi:(1->4)-alpha-D-glucan 1-alpha-D-glucosylmutase